MANLAGKHYTSTVLEGITQSSTAAGQIAPSLKKTGGQINEGNISPLPMGVGWNAELTQPEWGWGCSVTVC
jgi:hypothetical protein